MLQEFSLPKGQATDHYAGPCECMGLRVGTVAREVGQAFTLSVASLRVRCGVQGYGNLALTHGALGFPTMSQKHYRGAEGFGPGAEKFKH